MNAQDRYEGHPVQRFSSVHRRGGMLISALTICLVLIAGSLEAREAEVLPAHLYYVIRDDAPITQKVRIRGDFSRYTTFETVYKPDAIRVVGFDRPNASGVVELEVALQFPEGSYAETRDLWEELAEERIRRLRMRGEMVSKRHLPSMKMDSKLEIVVVGSTAEYSTITIPLTAVYDFSGRKEDSTSSEYVE
jgi:hypothetical protein